MIAVSIARGRHRMLMAEHRHLVEQGAELDIAIAGNARIGRPALGVFITEGGNNPLFEKPTEVHYMVGDGKAVGYFLCCFSGFISIL